MNSDAEAKRTYLQSAIQQRQAYEDLIAECNERLQEYQAIASSLDRPIDLNPEQTQEQLNDYKVRVIKCHNRLFLMYPLILFSPALCSHII